MGHGWVRFRLGADLQVNANKLPFICGELSRPVPVSQVDRKLMVVDLGVWKLV